MATAAPILSLVAGLVALLGVGGAYLGLLAPMTGFLTFVAGALLGGLLTTLVSLVGIVLSRGGRSPEGRMKSFAGLASGLGLVVIVLAAATLGGDAPRINDITTDLDDPPRFAPAVVVPEYVGRDMSYPEEWKEVVRAAYPDLAPLRVESPPDLTFNRAVGAADALGWEIVARSAVTGTFDARETTRIFRFVDDISVRIVADGSGSIVDVRSKSRDGQGDFGVNAARIRAFQDALR